MTILQVSHDDILTGAGKAAYRVHQLINRYSSHRSNLLVANKHSNDQNVYTAQQPVRQFFNRASPYFDQITLQLLHKKSDEFRSLNLWQTLSVRQVQQLQPDIIHLHWINHSLLKLQTLLHFSQPIFWTCHDLWPILGTKHYNSTKPDDSLDQQVIDQKKNIYTQLGNQLTFVAPSRWMAEQLKKSPLTQHNQIIYFPNLIDTTLFRPMNKAIAREQLHIDHSAKVIVMQGHSVLDKRKGGDRIELTCKQLLTKHGSDLQLHFFGHSAPQLPQYSSQVFNHGLITDETKLVLLFSAADIYLHLAREDNLPNTILEAHACGTPAIALNVGGIADLYTSSMKSFLLISDHRESTIFDKAHQLITHQSLWMKQSTQAAAHIKQSFSKSSLTKLYHDYYAALADHSLK